MANPSRGLRHFFEAIRRQAGQHEPVKPEDTASYEVLEKGAFKTWVKKLRDAHLQAWDLPEEVAYGIDGSHLRSGDGTGNGGSGATTDPSFIYLDVGAWVGTPKKHAKHPDSRREWWGDQTAISGYKRDFALICGPHVLLCGFSSVLKQTGYDAAKTDSAWTKAAAAPQDNGVKSLVALIKAIDASFKGAPLGDVVVVRYLLGRSTGGRMAWASLDSHWDLQVLIGDMHVPMVDSLAQAKPPRGPAGVVDPSAAVSQGPKRVRRYGRVDTKCISSLVNTLVTNPKEAKGLTEVLDFLKPLLPGQERDALSTWKALKKKLHLDSSSKEPTEDSALGRVIGFAAETSIPALAVKWEYQQYPRQFGDPDGVRNDDMAVEEAQAWFQHYQKGVGGSPPADIFEEAGYDFVRFVGALTSYSSSPDRLQPIQFVQLGDMFDYWVGFSAHFVPSKDKYAPVNSIRSESDATNGQLGHELVLHWTDNCLSMTKQGRQVARALAALNDLPREAVFLRGNHDNYLGDGLTPAYTLPSHWGNEESSDDRLWVDRPRHGRLTPRKAKWLKKGQGVYAEHGHQWEESNADDAQYLRAGDFDFGHTFIGSSSPIGVFLTQPAFIAPLAIRCFEGGAAGALSMLTPNRYGEAYGQRLTQMACATELFLKDNSFFCYAMGHTHHAALVRVRLGTAPSTKMLVEDAVAPVRALKHKAMELKPAIVDDTAKREAWFQGYGRSIRVLFDPEISELPDCEVVLVFPDDRSNQPPPYVLPCPPKGVHEVTFDRVRPGRYSARVYPNGSYRTPAMLDSQGDGEIARVLGWSFVPSRDRKNPDRFVILGGRWVRGTPTMTWLLPGTDELESNRYLFAFDKWETVPDHKKLNELFARGHVRRLSSFAPVIASDSLSIVTADKPSPLHGRWVVDEALTQAIATHIAEDQAKPRGYATVAERTYRFHFHLYREQAPFGKSSDLKHLGVIGFEATIDDDEK